MQLTLMQRIYFIAALAPLIAAVLFSGGAGAAGAANALACSVPGATAASAAHDAPAPATDGATTTGGYAGGGYGY